MRLCIYNPHIFLGVSVLDFIMGKNREIIRRNDKYGFILNAFKEKRRNTIIVLDGTMTTLSGGSTLVKFLTTNYFLIKTICFFEIYAWCLINGINPLKTKIIFSLKKLDPASDILLIFIISYLFSDETIFKKSFIYRFQGTKIIHANQYFGRTGKIAEKLRKTDIKIAIAEVDLKKSPYFCHFFNFIEKAYILPFVLRSRYKKMTDFKRRQNICIALGTLARYRTKGNDYEDVWKDHYEFFRENSLQPMRKIIYNKRHELSGLIESYIDPLIYKIDDEGKSAFWKKFKIARIIHTLFFYKSHSTYFSFDIVEKYNSFKMFIAPEENVGVPSINFVEGMACGCAYIGLDHSMYTDLGMRDGIHYIAYDGTLEDMKTKIRYYQNHPDELEKIAQTGYEFVKRRFTEEKIMDDLWEIAAKALKFRQSCLGDKV